MNTKKFSEALSELDNKYVDEALNYKREIKKKAIKFSWIRYGTMAACLCLLVVGAFFIRNNTPNTSPIKKETAYGFTMEESDVLYLPISFSQRKIFGIIDENATGLTDENTYKITDDDLGDIIGIVENSQDESIIGETVYHFINFPSDNSICIVKVNETYEFYVKEGVEGIEINNTPDNTIDAPVDENKYHDAKPVDPTEASTLEYINELHDKVSIAMKKGYLPFVSSSSIYEDPYRLHVVVSSNAERDLSKLKAYDTIGGILEIEYDVNIVSVENNVKE